MPLEYSGLAAAVAGPEGRNLVVMSTIMQVTIAGNKTSSPEGHIRK
jgi:hypothetical protein